MRLVNSQVFSKATLWVALTGFFVQGASALNFSSKIETSEWLVQGSIYECQIAQQIPEFGRAVFQHSAGEELRFYLYADTPRMKTGRAALRVTNPEWKPGGAIESLGFVDVKQDKSSIDLPQDLANRMLHELYQGRQVEFQRQAWFDSGTAILVALSNVNFRGAYDKYVGCLAELLPVNYAQVERTSLLFKPGQEELSSGETGLLDNIIIYYQADETVQSLFIDGHSDSKGTRAENLEVSKRRAEKVKRYLVDAGVDPSTIVMRWHGERYPVASNRTDDGRSQNRRVTVRLSKEPPPEVPEIERGVDGEEEALPDIDAQALLDQLGPAQ